MGVFQLLSLPILSLPFISMDLNARVGIGNTVKQMLKDKVSGSETEENLCRCTSHGSRRVSTGGTDPIEKLDDPASVTNSTQAFHNVLTVSGATATERLQLDLTTDQGLETMRSGQDIAGLDRRRSGPWWVSGRHPSGSLYFV
ncbi:hypothetical protein H1R20_g9563, partial [Candolleomyces eurysporus]